MLMQCDNLSRIFHIMICQLGFMDQPVFLNADIHKRSEIGYVGHYSIQYHSFFQVGDGLDAAVKFQNGCFLSRVTSRLLQFFYDIGKSIRINFRKVSLFDLVQFRFIPDQVLQVDPQFLSHLIDKLVAFRVNGRVIQGIFTVTNA
ncbi:hypothetical protein D3C86_1499470 [compost metagenome]